jgi:hypothetical protein
LSEADQGDIDAQKELNGELEITKTHADELGDALAEDEDVDMDKKASKAAKKGDSISKIANKLGETAREMKKTVNKWSKTEEGPIKDKLKNRLKELSKIKKELEGLL